MEYIELLPDDEVFPSSMLISCRCAVWILFLLGLDASSPSQLPFEAGLVGECDCRNRNFFFLSDGDVCYGRGFGGYKNV